MNEIFNKVMITPRDTRIAMETKSCIIYYYKLTNGKVVCLVETPALTYIEETSKKNNDNIHLERIIKAISESKYTYKRYFIFSEFS